MAYITESIGQWGVKTTPAHPMRMERPKSGDVVDFGENAGTYPFTHGQYGRVERTNWLGTEGLLLVCCEMGSAFLKESGSVDISGGPFWSGDLLQLEPTYTTKMARFWNWGNHAPGAHQGVDYHFQRPVFQLRLQEDPTA